MESRIVCVWIFAGLLSTEICARDPCFTGTRAVAWTLYTELHITWNEASRFCKEHGGYLPVLNTHITMNSLRNISYSWDSFTNGFWLGLYSVQSGEIPNVWEAKCCLQPPSIQFWSVELGEPDKLAVQFCVRMFIKTGGWRTNKCEKLRNLVCATDKGDCTYKNLDDTTITTFPNASKCRVGNVSTCWSLCLELRHNGEECVAAVLERTTLCKLYLGKSLLMENQVQTSPHMGSVTMLRRCFESAINQDQFPGFNYTNLSTHPDPAFVMSPALYAQGVDPADFLPPGLGLGLETCVSATTEAAEPETTPSAPSVVSATESAAASADTTESGEMETTTPASSTTNTTASVAHTSGSANRSNPTAPTTSDNTTENVTMTSDNATESGLVTMTITAPSTAPSTRPSTTQSTMSVSATPSPAQTTTTRSITPVSTAPSTMYSTSTSLIESTLPSMQTPSSSLQPAPSSSMQSTPSLMQSTASSSVQSTASSSVQSTAASSVQSTPSLMQSAASSPTQPTASSSMQLTTSSSVQSTPSSVQSMTSSAQSTAASSVLLTTPDAATTTPMATTTAADTTTDLVPVTTSPLPPSSSTESATTPASSSTSADATETTTSSTNESANSDTSTTAAKSTTEKVTTDSTKIVKKRLCPCSCSYKFNPPRLHPINLTVIPVNKTSKYKRTKTSAKTGKTSHAVVGTPWIVACVLLLCLFVMCDLNRLKWLQGTCHRARKSKVAPRV